MSAGNWIAYLKEQLDYKPTTAENLMRIYREFGSEQVDMLTGKTPAEVFGKLDQSQMVAMFGLEPEQRTELMETEGIEDMSSRQIAQLAKEKKAAEDEAERERKARENADKLAVQQADRATKAEQEVKDSEKYIKSLEEELERAKSELEAEKAQENLVPVDTSAQDEQIAKLQNQLDKLKEKHKKLQDKQKAAEDEIKQAVREEVMQEAQAEIDAALQAQAEAEHKLEKAKNPSKQKISLMFAQVQENIMRIEKELKLMEQEGNEIPVQLRATLSKTLVSMAKTIGGA